MAKRFTDSEMWDKEWYMKLSCKEKCLVNMVRSKADLCGVWSPNWIIASMYVGENVCEEELLKIDNGNQFRKLANGKIYCIGFIEFQYGELSEKSPVHRKVINLLSQNNLINNYKEIGYQQAINSLKEEEEVKEEEEDKDKEKDSGKKKIETEKLLIPEMIKIFKHHNPGYPANTEKDYPALLKIYYFIAENIGIEKDVGLKEQIMPLWENICDAIQKDNFFKNYSISQVEKHIQSIVLSIQNGGNNSNTKPNRQVTGYDLKQAHAKYFG